MHVGSVTDEEYPPVTVAGHGAAMHPVAGYPVLLDDLGREGNSLIDHRLELFVGGFAVLGARAVGSGREVAEDPVAVIARHRECRENACRTGESVEAAMRQLPLEFGIGHDELVAVGGPGERDTCRLAHRTVRAVAADDPAASQGLDRSIIAAQRHGHRLAVLGQIRQRPSALDLDALLAQQLGENALGVMLREGSRFRVGGVVLRPGQLACEVQLDRLRRKCDGQARRRVARGDRLVDHADVVEDLQGPGLHDQRAGCGRRCRSTIDDARRNPMPRQLIRHHQASRSRAHHQDRKYRVVHHLSPRCDFATR